MKNLTDYSQMVGISEDDLLGKSREYRLSIPRQIHWLYLRSEGYSYDKIADLYGRTRGTIISGVNTIKNMIKTRDSAIEPYMHFINSFSRQDVEV